MENSQKEIMLIAQEECAEVTQAISKIFRFGLLAKHPDQTANNQERLEEEVGDLLCMIELMVEKNIIDRTKMLTAAGHKRNKLQKWSNIFQKEEV